MTGLSSDGWRAALAEMGPSAELDCNRRTKAFFAPLVRPAGGVLETRDTPYGADPRQTLDVYAREGLSGARIVLYVPGGGFTGGDKRQDETFFRNVGRFFASRGWLGVTMNYRLAPGAVWPSAALDVRDAVRFLKANAARFGADPMQIVVFGHSAGAAHVATYLFDPELGRGADVIGAVLGSGLYALRPGAVRDNVAHYFGSDVASYERRSALSHVAGTTTPVYIALAEYDPPMLSIPSFELAAALTLRDGRPPPIQRVAGHNHFSYVCTLGTADESFSAPLLRFMESL